MSESDPVGEMCFVIVAVEIIVLAIIGLITVMGWVGL
jgi:hypothetical protein